MTKLQAILVALVVYVFGCFSGCILHQKYPQENVDKHELENKKYERQIDSALKLFASQKEDIIQINKRISNTDSLILNNNKKGNEEKNTLHHLNSKSKQHWSDSVLRANHIN